jgi:hypothetical protein
MRVCQPAPSARKASSTSGSKRIATCSLVGFLFLPRTRRICVTVAVTPLPRVTTAPLQSFDLRRPSGAAAIAASICFALKAGEKFFGFFALCISARYNVSARVTLGPNQNDDPALVHSEAHESLLSVGEPIVFLCEHWGIKHRLQQRQIDPVPPLVWPTFRLIPGDHK